MDCEYMDLLEFVFIHWHVYVLRNMWIQVMNPYIQIQYINQLSPSRRPNMAWSESEFEESMPNTCTQTNVHLLGTKHYGLGRDEDDSHGL